MELLLWTLLIVLGSIALILVTLILWYGIYLLVRKYIFEKDTEKKKAVVVTTMLLIFLSAFCFNEPMIKTNYKKNNFGKKHNE